MWEQKASIFRSYPFTSSKFEVRFQQKCLCVEYDILFNSMLCNSNTFNRQLISNYLHLLKNVGLENEEQMREQHNSSK